MSKSSPLLLLVATLCLVITVLTAFWIGLMPQRLLTNLSRQLKKEQGLVLEARSPRIGFEGAPVLTLQSVSLGRDGGFDLSSPDVKIELGYASLFGGQPDAMSIDFGAPVISFDVAKPFAAGPGIAPEIKMHDAVIKLRDSRNGNALAFGDVNGKLNLAKGIKLELSLVQNGNLTTFAADIENADRFFDDGSPADITLASREKVLSFSGRARSRQELALDGQMTLEGAEVQTLLAWFGMPFETLKGAGEIKMTSGLSTQGLVANLSNITAQIGGNDVAGSANIQPRPDRAAISAEISMPSLALLPKSNLLAMAWSEQPIALADLKTVDADIRLKTENLVLREQSWGPSEATIKVSNGNADVVVFAKQTTLALKSSTRAEFDIDLQAKNVETKTLLGGLVGFDHSSGLADMSFKATASGNRLAALVSTLKGKLAIVSAKLKFAGTDIRARLSTPGEGWQTGMSESGVNIEAQIGDGIATLTRADLGTLKLKGEIDLLRQAFDLQVMLKGKIQAINGPWVRPLFVAQAGASPELRPITAPPN